MVSSDLHDATRAAAMPDRAPMSMRPHVGDDMQKQAVPTIRREAACSRTNVNADWLRRRIEPSLRTRVE